MQERKLYSVKEAAALISVKPSTIRTWINQGKLRAIRLGRLFRIPAIAIDDLTKKPTTLKR